MFVLMGVILNSPAKINLGLRVLGRRSDGYHEIDTIMMPIDLCDTIEVKQAGQSIQVTCPDHPKLDGRANLAWHATDLFLNSGDYEQGVSIKIFKKIPIDAGLGGGSSNAAYTLMALRNLLDPNKPMSEIFSIAAQLGADVPFFLHNGACRARGIGHKLDPIVGLPSFWILLACAPFGLKTREVFENLNYSLTLDRINDKNNFPFSFMNLAEFKAVLYNDLQPVAERLRPSIRKVCEEIRKSGALTALMTGSGPTVFGLFQSKDKAMRALAITEKEPGWRCLIAREIKSNQISSTE